MALTVLGMSGLNVKAAAPQAGDLIKMDGLSAVYFLGNDGKRYVFPTSAVYFSWHKDFSGVVTISSSELQSYPLGGNIAVRPGTKLVKITTDPSVYAVEANGTLRKIQSEADAIAIYGANWAKRVIDVPDAFFTNYTIGTPLTSGTVAAGTLVKNANSAAIYYFDGTNYRSIATEAAFNANRFDFANVVTLSSAITAGGTAITGAEFAYDPQTKTTGPVVTGSGLTASISSATPAAISVPQNGARVPMAKVNLTAANDGAISVSSILVKRIGLSSYDNIDKVWAEKDGVIVASKKTMNSNDEATLTFSPALNINAGQTVALDLIASLKGTGAGTIGLSIASASAVSASAASISGSFPVSGNLMSPTNYTVVNLAISASGSNNLNAKVGDTGVELGSFTLAANSPAKDVTIKSIMLKNNGVEDLAKSVSNLYLEQAGSKVSTSASIDGRFVTFTLNNGAYDLLKDDGSKSFKIKGDIIAKENSSSTGSYVFQLNKSTDLNVVEKTSGFGANVVYNGVSADSYAISTVNITSGAINLSKKTTSPSDSTVVKGNNGLVALIANFKVDEAITADGMKINYGSTMSGAASTTDKFQNAKVYLNGVLVDSFDPAASSTSYLTATLDSTITLNKGDNEIKVVVDAKSDATSGAIKFWLNSNVLTNENPEYVQSGNQVSSNEIGGSAEGAVLTIGSATLSITRSDGYGNNKSVVKGSSDISLGKFTVKATNDAVTITSAQLGANIGSAATTTANSIYDMKLYVDGAQVGNTVDFGTSGANFNSLNVTIAKDSTKTIEVFGAFDSSAVEGSHFVTALTLYAQDSKGKSVSVDSQNTTQFAISGQGTLNVAVGGNTPNAALLAANTTEQEVAQFKFTAVNDSASLTEIQVYNYASGTVDASADSRVSSVRLYDGATLIDSFTPVFGGGKFTITNDKVKVLSNQSKDLSIKVVLNTIDNDASSTNKVLAYRITDYKFKSSNGTETPIANQTVTANKFVIRKTVPTIAFLDLPDKTLNAGTKDIAKFSVTADASGDISLSRVALDVATTTNATLATSSVTNTLKVNGSTKNVYSVTLSGGQYIVVFNTPEIISAGTTKTFEIQGVTSVTNNSSDSITAKISQDSVAAYSTTSAAGVSTPAGNFVWSDGADVSNYTWANGANVKGLDTNTWVLSK